MIQKNIDSQVTGWIFDRSQFPENGLDIVSILCAAAYDFLISFASTRGVRRDFEDMEPQPQSPDADDKYERELERLIGRLPRRLIEPINWLRRPTSRWARIPAGILFIFGGVLSFLPILGIWMLPLGFALLAEDLPMLRKMRNRILDRLAKRRGDSLQTDRDQSSANGNKNGSGDISE